MNRFLAAASLGLVVLGAGASPALAAPRVGLDTTSAVEVSAADQRPQSGAMLFGASFVFLGIGAGSALTAQRRRWNSVIDLRDPDVDRAHP